MWKMRWKLISLSAALIVVTSAQLSTIDNVVVVQPDNLSSNEEDQNSTVADYLGHDNSSYNSDIKDELPLTDGRAISANSIENEESNNVGALNFSSDTKVMSSGTRELSNSESYGISQNSKESNELLKSSESSKSQGSENGSPQKRSSEETPENSQSEESNTNEKPGNEAAGSSASAEGGASSQDSSVDVTSTEEEEIQTTHGPVKGYQWTSHPDITAFYDIPYGKFQHPFEVLFVFLLYAQKNITYIFCFSL